MRLNEKLHLVIPLYDDEEVSTIQHYAHSAPISREVFEAHFLLLSKTFTAIHAEGLGEIAGPRVAALIMRKVAERMNDQEGHQALMNEIRRLSNVMTRTGGKWVTMPMQDAIDTKAIGDDDLSEIENAIVFFIVSSVLLPKERKRVMLDGAATLWGAQITSLDCMGFAASLPTSTAIVNTGVSQRPVSSVPH